MSRLVPPHGGRGLRPLLVDEAQRSAARKRASSLPQLRVTSREKGDLIIAKLSPEKYEEISRARLVEPINRDPGRAVVWSHPAFANKSVYARNDKELVCVSLAVPAP